MRNRDANYNALISQHILNYVNRVLQFRLKLEGLSKERTGEKLVITEMPLLVSRTHINCTLSLISNCVFFKIDLFCSTLFLIRSNCVISLNSD